MKIGIVIAMQEEMDNILNVIRKNCMYYEEYHLNDDVVSLKMRENQFYFYQSGIGNLNSLLGACKLHREFNCDMICNIGCCGCFKSERFLSLGSIIEFDKNILNFGYQLNPYKYHYDDCKISDYLNLDSDFDNLLLSCHDFTREGIANNPYLKIEKYKNVFLDMEGYGVLAYCLKNRVKYKILKIVSDSCVEEEFDENVLNEKIYSNVFESLKTLLV